MKKHLVSAAIALVMITQTAYAMEISAKRDIDSASFSFSGMIAPESSLSIDIYAPDKSAADLLKAQNSMDIIKYHNEIYADRNGAYSFTAEIKGESGIYPAYAAADGEIKTIKLEFINVEANQSALAGLNAASDLKSYIAENKADLGFFLELYDEVNQDEVCSMLKANLPLDQADKAINVFNEAVVARAISEKKIQGAVEQFENLAILNDDGKIAKWYKGADSAAVDKRLYGKSFKSTAEFELALGEAVVLEIINNPNGYENVKNVINDFANEIGISSPTDKTVVYQSLSGKNYSDYSTLKSAYNTFLSSSETGGGSGSGRTPSSGSSKVSTGGGMAFQENLNPQPIEKIYFSDMENAEWAKPAVWYLAEKNIISGKSETEFCPGDYVNREEFVTMIVRAFEIEKYTDANEFADVSKNDWFYEYVLAAFQNGAVSGIRNDYFGAGERITRQDMAAILYRVLDIKKIELEAVREEAAFDDWEDISDYAKTAVSHLQMRGIINGMEDNRFCAREYASRAQAAQMIYKIVQRWEEKI